MNNNITSQNKINLYCWLKLPVNANGVGWSVGVLGSTMPLDRLKIGLNSVEKNTLLAL